MTYNGQFVSTTLHAAIERAKMPSYVRGVSYRRCAFVRKAMKIQCPNCQKTLDATDHLPEKPIKCSGCGKEFLVEVRRQGPSLAERVRLPNLSGKASAAWLAFCFLLTAVLIPMALRLPRWVEFEFVLACWWAIWLVVLTWWLATGFRVSDDYRFRKARNWFGSSEDRRGMLGSDSGWWDWFPWVVPDIEGCGAILAVIAGLILLIGAIWFLFEVAIPVVLFLLYFAVRGMLAQVVNDRHHCRGHIARAFAWGILWATAYTAPLAGVVWFIHFIHRSRGA